MIGHPPVSHEAFDEMYRLVTASLSGELSPQQRDRLNQLVHGDVQGRSLYLKLIFESSILLTWAGHAESKTVHERTPSPLPSPGIPPAAFHGVAGYFSSGWPVAYLIATIIFAVGLTIAAVVHVSRPDQTVQPSSLPSPVDGRGAGGEGGRYSPSSSIVGRITGMVDCQWEGAGFRGQGSGDGMKDSLLSPLPSPLIHLGDRLALRSGLLEITYDTGARVILQGPVTYAVESPAGGYLSLGRLTAKLEKKSKVRGQRSESANEKSEVKDHKSFAVRTPTAVVTDLGTEFGVEVTHDGLCEVRVFQGLVETVACRDGKAVGQPQQVSAGQSARISKDRNDSPVADIAVSPVQAGSQRFVRQMPVPPANRLRYIDQMGSFGTCVVADNDLINAGQPTLASVELTSGTAGWESSITRLNDGTIYAKSDKYYNDKQITEATFNPLDGAVVTVTLNTQLHPHGYDIESIASLTGSGGRIEVQDRSSQRYDIAYSTVAAPDTFIALRGDKNATVDCSARGMQELWIRVFSGRRDVPIASRVSKLRFTFHNTDSRDPESMYREIDVFGMPTGEQRGTGRQN